MEDPTPMAGPSRSRRQVDNNDIAHKIVALQRKNASLPPGERNGPSSTASPSKSRNPPRNPSSPRPPHSSLRSPAEINEFSRGPVPGPSSRALFDPSRPTAPQLAKLDRSPRPSPPQLATPAVPDTEDRDRPRRRLDSRRNEPSSTGKKLFDPSIHDPHHFSAPRPTIATPPNGLGVLADSSEAGSSSRSLLRRAAPSRTPEEEADRERERRKRREGSERGSLPSKRKDSDQKSKGSRSSEGSESFKDRERGKGKNDTGVKPILKRIHDEIKELEQELIEMHRKMAQDPEAGISVLFDRSSGSSDIYSRNKREVTEGVESAAWIDLIAKHKRLAELHDHFLITLFDPLVPSSYHQLSVKYNIPSRLWQTAFHLLLERLRHAWMSNHPTALDLLTDVVYDAYRFYSELLENQALCNFRTAWIEALGDLARYRMAIASHVQEASTSRSDAQYKGRIDVDTDGHGQNVAPEPSGASIGAEVAQSWDVEDKETWRTTARDWYTMGITEKPGEGRLHHHLALLCRDVKGEEGRALHHFVKSLTVTHEFPTSRESILPLFDSALQSKRSLPDATANDLFIRLHGMLFTKISLDDFPSVMSRFMERLEEDASLDGISRKVCIGQTEWMIMGAVNLASVLQYGSTSGVIRKALSQEGAERRRAHAAVEEEEEGDEGGDGSGGFPSEGLVPESADMALQRSTSPMPLNGDSPIPAVPEDPPPITFMYALQLAFQVFDFTLAHPNRIQGFHQVLNPYITIFLTFLSTLFRQAHVGASLADHVPWDNLVKFLNSSNIEITEEKRLATGPPLPEDWLLRGMEWVGRRVYERGFWKGKSSSRGSSGGIVQPRLGGGDRFSSEMDVLLANFEPTLDISEGVVDDEVPDNDGPGEVNKRRWKRVAWAAGVLVKHVDGLELREGKIAIEGTLKEKMEIIQREKEMEREEERRREKRKMERRREEELALGLDEMDVERHGYGAGDYPDSVEGEDDPELAALRNRRRELQGLLSDPSSSAAPQQAAKPARASRKRRSALHVVQGYTMLLFDTNVLVDSLDLFKKVVESGLWSVVVPLPVVTELDGLSKEPAPLGVNAKCAVTYLEARIRTHSLCLKIQTTKGNYLSDLLIRTEHHDSASASASASANAASAHEEGAVDVGKTMDDRIISIASFAQDNFTDRSGLLGMPKLGQQNQPHDSNSLNHDTSRQPSDGDGPTTKVLVVSNDRNLRLMARSRDLQSVDEKELSMILSKF
ncbi:hypothetical protein I316_01397 [Kwoniella heveanensis BCC8398]|uniref:PIN domain-containing protein n=1 Tax=Kwoniella heveanensis BCC8398 TaxID=1296120 RepID=A0A1B9H0K6_9TREE|nr:hypothetical protein I316_01397 [Kwoniella heveanensis BCC8398]